MSAPSKTLPPADDDPLASAFPVRRNLPAFLLSAAFHAVLLLMLTTISVTVAKQVQKINVKILSPPPDAIEDVEVVKLGTGHWPQFTQPEALGRAIVDAVRG